MQLIGTCPKETKPALVFELEALGVENIVPGYRAVAFERDSSTGHDKGRNEDSLATESPFLMSDTHSPFFCANPRQIPISQLRHACLLFSRQPGTVNHSCKFFAIRA